jgi:hypothetical protein
LRLVDDDEEVYRPFMEIAPRKREEPVGSFESLVLMKVEGF